MQPLARIPNVELWEVKGKNHNFLLKSDWIITNSNNIIKSQIGSTQWNLDKSLPSLKAGHRSYVFAINYNQKDFYCVNIPFDADPEETLVLEAILNEFTQFEIVSESILVEDGSKDHQIVTTTKTDQGLGTATTVIVSGVQSGAEFINKAVRIGSQKYMNKYVECQPKQICQVKQIAKETSKLPSTVVGAITDITSKVADIIIGTTKKSDKEPPGNVKRVAAAVLVSAAEIYQGMEDAFITVLKSSADATTDIITHKYGDDMGAVVNDGLSTVGHTADTMLKARKIGVKTILKSTAKKTAIRYITNENKSLTAPSSSSSS